MNSPSNFTSISTSLSALSCLCLLSTAYKPLKNSVPAFIELLVICCVYGQRAKKYKNFVPDAPLEVPALAWALWPKWEASFQVDSVEDSARSSTHVQMLLAQLEKTFLFQIFFAPKQPGKYFYNFLFIEICILAPAISALPLYHFRF